MNRAIRGALLLAGLAAATTAASAAAKHRPAPKRPAAEAAPAADEAAWTLGRGRNGQTLFYGMPGGTAIVIAFDCAPRGGDVVISVPEASGKAKPDENQTVSLTIGGVRSSFAGRVVEDADGALALTVTVSARNTLFTAMGGPGGMRIEGRGFAKSVPLRGIGPKLNAFIGACKRS